MSERLQIFADQRPRTRFAGRRLRQPVRLAALVAFLALLVAARETPWAVVAPAASPLVALAAILTTRAVVGINLLGLVVLAIVVWQRRWFCHWVCPTGWCADRASALGQRMKRHGPRWPAMGLWIAVFILAGACAGYPFLLWLDPLAMLGAAVAPLVASYERSAWLFVGGMAAVLVVSVVWPNAWCAHLCPLGGLQDAAHRVRNLVRPRRRGTAWHDERPASRPLVFKRRTVLAIAMGAAWGAFARTVGGRSAAPLRPPGSVDASRFSALCIRCGNCARACPTHVITHEWGEYGVAGLLTPKVEYRDDYCLESCNQCTMVCPSGAIQPIPLEEKVHTRMGSPVVDADLCLLSDDRECWICRNRCPYDAVTLEFDERSYTLTPRVDMSRCPGCGACEAACPTQPVKAIVIKAANCLFQPDR